MDLRAQLQATLGTAYTLERELGGGGMSRVFLADEAGLGRKVVIKVLPAEAAGALSVERFKREIQLAAALQQANIVPVLNAGETNGIPFYTMPYVEGESLRAKLAAGGELPVIEAVGILKEVARALSYAHSRGIVHRDIKPDNVLLSEGTAMVTDFGIAKALSEATTDGGGTGITGTGMTLGTPAYMSPEQAAADPAIDHRADIYAFGCLAYELLTGAPPFAGRSPSAMIAAHATATVEPLDQKRPGIPKPLAALVMRCLEKRPADRPQKALEIVSALEQVSSEPRPVGPGGVSFRFERGPAMAVAVAIVLLVVALAALPLLRVGPARTRPVGVSIAVMPLDVKGNDSTTQFFAGALADRLRGELVRAGMLVAPRGSSQTLKDQNAPASDAARKLHVTAVLSGGVERLGSKLRVTLELTDTSGFAVWDRTIEKEAADPLAIEDEVFRESSDALRQRFDATLGAAGPGHKPDAVAFDFYSRGVFWYRRGTEADLARSIEYYKRAIHHDTAFADAYSGLAQAYIWFADAYAPPKDVIPPALAAARRAAALDDRSSEAHSMIGEMLWGYYHDWDAARIELDRAIALDPNNAEPVLWKAWMAVTLGDTLAARGLVRGAMRQDPLDPFLALLGPAVMTFARAPDAALVMFARARSTNVVPADFVYLEAWDSEAFRMKGQLDRALAADSVASRIVGHPTAGLVLSLARLHRLDDARRAAQALADASHRKYFLPELVALGWVAVGENEKAMDELERGVRNLSGGASYNVSCFPEFRALRVNPRFEKYLQTVNLSAYFR